VRKRFVAVIVASAAKPAITQYHSKSPVGVQPKTVAGSSTIASTPPVRKSQWMISQTMICCEASVAIARYSPLRRSAGRPKNAPTTAVTRTATSTPTSGERSLFVATTPAE
jgi:hypothetical protein